MTTGDSKLRFGLTEAGRVVLRGTAFVVLAAFIVPAFGVLCILACVLATALVVGFAVRPKVRIDGHLPDRLTAGRTADLTYTITNAGRLTAYHLTMGFAALPQAIEQVTGEHAIWRLGPGETAHITVTIRPTRRGCHKIGQPVCRSAFPFNLFWFGVSRRGEETLVVLPAFSRLQMPLQQLGRHMQTAGMRLAGRVGVSPEYIGSRPFIPGDSPRRIDARAWARLAAPATKEYDEDCDNCAAIVLDTRVRDGAARAKSGQIDELEAAVSLCASVAFTMNGSHVIDLLLAGTELHEFSGWSREARVDRIHEILAAVEPWWDGSAEGATLSLADRLPEMSQVVFILLDWSDTNRRLIERAERAGCYCTIVRIGDPGESRAGVHPMPAWAGSVRTVWPQEVLSGQLKQL
jgi:uncharacterized protein (DUF58 family)